MHELDVINQFTELVASVYFTARDELDSDDPVGLITDILNAVDRGATFF
ncbi:MAG: hypothetical protein OEY55_03630 [Acidimicrobiia bacterium]|nr:hypothetical protein [Acidimicrobiia bacterium]MDH5503355.1 hypothetical protein [Acidimicrobiia bacterium]